VEAREMGGKETRASCERETTWCVFRDVSVTRLTVICSTLHKMTHHRMTFLGGGRACMHVFPTRFYQPEDSDMFLS